jgi:hypothetical protein
MIMALYIDFTPLYQCLNLYNGENAEETLKRQHDKLRLHIHFKQLVIISLYF